MKNSAWLIGRADANEAHIQLHNATISQNHATLNYHDGKFYLIDNNSTNGTFLRYAEQSVYLNQHYEVQLEDEIYIGEKRYFLHELIDYTQGVDGVETAELLILDRKQMEARSREDKIKKRPQKTPTHKSKSEKRIRCFDCTSPIFSNSACPKCGSRKHFEEMEL